MAKGLFITPRFFASGDRVLLMAFGDTIDLQVNEKVRAMTELLRSAPPPGVEYALPAYRSLAVVYDPLVTAPAVLQQDLLLLAERLADAGIPEPRTVEIPVCYGGDLGPDIGFVAGHCGMDEEDIVTLHTAPLYHIYTIGFAPGFCYLGGLDERLHTPRLETPRTWVSAGSVGIAEAQTGIYPLDTPGGWRLIGRTPLKLFDAGKSDPFLYQTGDKLRFVAIARDVYERMLEEAPS